MKTTYGAQLQIGFLQDYEYERQWTVKEGQAVFDQYITPLNDYQNEKITAFITGKEDIQSEWDIYIKKCRELGADKLAEVYQSAYDRYLQAQN